ncbi:MAG: sel1 repeat family protein [Pseudomonadota bacterium]|nr:sel1 repeat family protein [Pseudomonadota bacterium]
MLRRALVFGLASFLLSTVADAGGTAAKSPWREEMIWRLRIDDRLASLFAVCPADVAGRRAARKTAVAAAATPDCERDPVACHERCAARDGDACLSLAQTLEAERPALPTHYWKSVYTAACELGEASGCTNRASALRNLDDADPLDSAAEPAANCEYRSFRYACAHEDAWGCAMLGQALMNGEGVAADASQAKAMVRKTCAIAPDFEACEFARRLDASTQ